MLFFKNKQFKAVVGHLEKGEHKEAAALMLKWQSAYVAIFQQQFPEHKQTLRHADFDEFWQTRREGLRLSTSPSFRFQRQPSLNDADFVTGYIYYLMALKNKDSNRYEEYLALAINHGSLHAVQTVIHSLIMANNKQSDYATNLSNQLLPLDKFAERYGTPGYLLLANGYLHVAISTVDKPEAAAQNSAAFSYVWKNLQLAHLAEEDSTAAIHNTYFGKGLEASNSFKIGSVNKMLEQCRQLAGDAFPLAMQNYVKNQAVREYQAPEDDAYGQTISEYNG